MDIKKEKMVKKDDFKEKVMARSKFKIKQSPKSKKLAAYSS